jgi:hypothetical protein
MWKPLAIDPVFRRDSSEASFRCKGDVEMVGDVEMRRGDDD